MHANSGVGDSILVGLVSVCGHTASVYLEADSDFCPLVFQGSQEQRETGKPREAEETSGQEGRVLGQPPHPLPQPREVSHTAITHSCHPVVTQLTFSYAFCSLAYLIKDTLAGTLMAPMNNNKIPFP